MKKEISAGYDSWTFDCEQCLESARQELAHAIYMSECGGNAGMRKIYSNKANMLSRLIYMAEHGLVKEESANFVLETDLKQVQDALQSAEDELEQTKVKLAESQQAYQAETALRENLSGELKTAFDRGWLAGASFMRDLCNY